MPTIIFLIIVFISYFKCDTKEKQKRLKKVNLILTLTLAIYYLAVIFFDIYAELTPVTNTRYYKEKVTGDLLNVFPKDIPKNVKKIKFDYTPGFLQGASNISLYYVDDNMTASKFENKYSDKSEWVGSSDDYSEKEGLFSGLFYNTPAQSNNKTDYIIYLNKSKCDESGYCNHGYYLLSAFNKKTKEVIYQYREW